MVYKLSHSLPCVHENTLRISPEEFWQVSSFGCRGLFYSLRSAVVDIVIVSTFRGLHWQFWSGINLDFLEVIPRRMDECVHSSDRQSRSVFWETFTGNWMRNKRTRADKGSHAEASRGYWESGVVTQAFNSPTSGLLHVLLGEQTSSLTWEKRWLWSNACQSMNGSHWLKMGPHVSTLVNLMCQFGKATVPKIFGQILL